jgi:hypothetical protein
MIEVCPVGRAGTPDVANIAALLMNSDGGFITGDFQWTAE